MSEQDRDEAIHPASEIKLARARQQGESCRSDALAQAAQAALGLGLVGLAAVPLATALLDWTRDYWMQSAEARRPGPDLVELLTRLGWPLGIFLLALFAAGVLSHLLQSGWNWGQRPLLRVTGWHPDQLLRQWFSPSRWLVALSGVLGCAGLFAWWWTNSAGQLEELSQLWASSPEALAPALLGPIRTWLLPLVGGLLLIGGLDYALQRWLLFRRLQMTDQELRDEQKDERNLARTAIRKRKRVAVR